MKSKSWAACGLLAGALGGGWGCEGERPVVGSSESTVGQPDGVNGSVVGLVEHYIDQIQIGSPEEGRCLPRKLAQEEDGSARCTLVRLFVPEAECDCNRPGFGPPPGDSETAAKERARATGVCDNDGTRPCTDFCACEFLQASGTDEVECLNAEVPTEGTVGWCYVNDGRGNPSLISSCPTSSYGMIRALDPSIPDAVLFLACATELRTVAPAPVGAPCLPDVESSASFGNFHVTEASVELGSQGCQSGICLVNHFQGRVSCPYGQPGPEYEPARCFLPGSAESVSLAVEPQLVDRPPETSVTCSCRCDGPGDGPFCPCPDGLVCEPLFDALGLPGEEAYVGSYCLSQDSIYNPAAGFPRGTCIGDSADSGTCGAARPF